MGTISGTVERRNDADRGVLTILAAALKRMCVAYITWRMEQAIMKLNSMSDTELNDIGLARPESMRCAARDGASGRST